VTEDQPTAGFPGALEPARLRVRVEPGLIDFETTDEAP